MAHNLNSSRQNKDLVDQDSIRPVYDDFDKRRHKPRAW